MVSPRPKLYGIAMNLHGVRSRENIRREMERTCCRPERALKLREDSDKSRASYIID